MDDRVNIRPEIHTIEHDLKTLEIEDFQNKVLRPILKLQNELLKSYFSAYIENRKIKWEKKIEEEQHSFIQKALTKDGVLRNGMIHLIIGQMTPEEFRYYNQDTREFNKRIRNMLQERLIDQLVFS